MDSQTGLRMPKGSSKWRLPMLIATVLLVLGGVVAGVWWFMYSATPEPRQQAQSEQVAPPAPIGLQSNILFMGDVYWGRYMNEWSLASPLKEAYPFSRLNEFRRSQYDAWVANLECPAVTGAHPTAAAEEATLNFNCPPSYVPEAAKWFTVFSNANNHSDNQHGQTGLDETRAHLDAAGIQYFGNFDPTAITKLCEVVALPVQVRISDGSKQQAKLPFAMCGYHGVFRVPQADSLAVMQQYSKYMPVIVYPHMGTEYKSTVDSLRRGLYHSMIDNGADIVFGNHPHWVQPSEAYKGHPIFYSMGNFIFDQQLKPETTRSAAIDVTLSLADNAVSSNQLVAWTKLGESCVKFEDDCLNQAKQQDLQRLPLTFQLKIIGVDISDKITRPASGAITAAIKQRLNWTTTTQQLTAPFSGY